MKKLGTFREFLNEEKELEKFIESAGNLKGLPKNIVKKSMLIKAYIILLFFIFLSFLSFFKIKRHSCV